MSSYLDTIRGAIFAGISLTAIFFAGTFFFVAIFNPPSRIIGLWRDRT